MDDPLQVSSSSTQAAGNTLFTVTVASSSGSAKGTAQGNFILAGTPIVQPKANAYGVVATLTPSQATAGQETSAQYVVQVTNTGSTEETLSAQVSGLPGGVRRQLRPSNQRGRAAG